MNYSDYRFSLDINESVSAVCPRVKKGDTIRRLIITLTQNGRPYLPGEGCSAVFRGEKPDGTVLFNECTVDNGRLTIPITSQTIAAAGTVKCEISLYSEKGDLLTSPTFDIAVDDTVSDDGAIESTNEYTALARMIGEVGGIDRAVKDAITKAIEEEVLVSPTVSVTPTSDGHLITVTDKNGEKQFEMINGERGKDGADGKDGTSTSHSWQGTVLTVTSASGTASADLKGEKGDDGASAYDIAREAGFTGTEREFAEKLAYPDVGIHIGASSPEDDNAVLWVDTDAEAEGGSPSGGNVSTPDWNQNDETASDYIKNRPFYSELVEILPETTAKTIDLGGLPGIVLPFVEFNPVNVYKVTYNGKIYTCSRVMSLDANTRMIGNTGVLDGTGDTGEPFIAVSQGDYTMVADFSGATEVTIKIERENAVKKLSPHFLDPQIFFVDAYYSEEDSIYKTDITVSEIESAISTGKSVTVRLMLQEDEFMEYKKYLPLIKTGQSSYYFGGVEGEFYASTISFLTLELSINSDDVHLDCRLRRTTCSGEVVDW